MSSNAQGWQLIFDWDGTCLDNTSLIQSSMVLTCQQMGIAVPPQEALDRNIGNPPAAIVAMCFPHLSEHEVNHLFTTLRKHYAAQPKRLFPGTIETIQQLKQQGHEPVVATNKRRALLDEEMAVLGCSEEWYATICADEVEQLKPHPEMLLKIMNKEKKAIMIGDTQNDILAAHAAGMPGIILRNGMAEAREQQLLQWCQPNDFLEDITVLPAWLSKQINTGKED